MWNYFQKFLQSFRMNMVAVSEDLSRVQQYAKEWLQISTDRCAYGTLACILQVGLIGSLNGRGLIDSYSKYARKVIWRSEVHGTYLLFSVWRSERFDPGTCNLRYCKSFPTDHRNC